MKTSEIQENAKIEVTDLYVSYDETVILENITFDTEQGERIAVVGPNGAGKSTLFKTIVGLIPFQKGKIYIHGLPLGHHQDCVAYIPQREEVDWTFPVTVFDVVMMGRYNKQQRFKIPSKTDYQIVIKTLKELDIQKISESPLNDLSGGQQQRVFIARSLAQEPHILLMDEPFNGVDISTKETIWSLLDNLKTLNVTVMVATHDLNMAAQHFDRILLLNKKLISFGSIDTVFSQENLSSTFGSQVMFLNGTVIVDQCCPPQSEDKKQKNS